MTAVIDGVAQIDSGVRDEQIAGAMDDFDIVSDQPLEEWHDNDLKYDEAAGGVRLEIERRASLLGEAYPFSIESGRLVYTGARTKAYEFCLATVVAPNITSGVYVIYPRLFERLCAWLVQKSLGPLGRSFHTGAPRDGKPQPTFRQAVEAIQREAEEFSWRPDDGLPQQGPSTGDAGLDFVVYQSSICPRLVGQLFILGQCACGEDWTEKWNDLTLPKLGKWIKLPPVAPTRVLAVPFVLSEGYFRDATKEAGIVIDRVRVSLYSDMFDEELNQVWGEKIESAVGHVF